MKKSFAFAFIALSLCFAFVSSVSAYISFGSTRYVVQSAIDTGVSTFEPILSALFGGYGGWSGYFLFERTLLFILLVSIVYLAVGKVPAFQDKKAIKWIIAIIIPLIGIRFMDFEWLTAIFLQYEVLAIVLVAILPFIIYLFFLLAVFPSNADAYMRKFAWGSYALVYLGLWSTSGSSARSNIYLWTMIVSFAMIFLDGYIERLLHRRELGRAERGRAAQFIADLDHQIRRIQESALSAADKKDRLKELEDQRKYWQRRL